MIAALDQVFVALAWFLLLMCLLFPRFTWRTGARLWRLGVRWWRHVRPLPPRPERRPIEFIAKDAWRIGSRYHANPEGLRFAKVEGIRRAYDDVLAEACEALGITHLLRILPPGEECDTERRRVEYLLGQAGIDLPDAA